MRFVSIAFLIFFSFQTKASESYSSQIDDDTSKMFTKVEIMPSFPGGFDSLQHYFQSSVILSKECIKDKCNGRIYSSVVITSSGEISQEWVGGNLNYGIKDMVLNSIRNMPHWNPGKHKGENVTVFTNLDKMNTTYNQGVELLNNLELNPHCSITPLKC